MAELDHWDKIRRAIEVQIAVSCWPGQPISDAVEMFDALTPIEQRSALLYLRGETVTTRTPAEELIAMMPVLPTHAKAIFQQHMNYGRSG